MCFYYKSVLWTFRSALADGLHAKTCKYYAWVIQEKVHIRCSLGFKLHPCTIYFFFQILNWFCVSASTSAIYFFQQIFCRKVLAADISGCNLFCIRQIGKYLAFLWRPSIFNTFWKNPFIKAIQADGFDTLLIPPLPDIAICHLFRSERAVPK